MYQYTTCTNLDADSEILLTWCQQGVAVPEFLLIGVRLYYYILRGEFVLAIKRTKLFFLRYKLI